ncbi:MAG: hypothetical protein M3Z14_01945, partial [Candidatus Eremiobacteraeota bacterium]|nr:hypothetical protein [Candidatus Eremiobacteraeota bacterium]
MRMFLTVAASAVLTFLAPAKVWGQFDPTVSLPPVAAKIPYASTAAGYTRNDDYFWLRGKEKREVQRYLQAENAYTTAVMKPTEPLQAQLYDEMLSHIKQTDLGVPYKLGAYY